MSSFFNYHKAYMPQAQHRPYQPECTIDNPAPSDYNPNSSLRGRNIKYSFKSTLKRFRETARWTFPYLSNSPGPAAYHTLQTERTTSFDAKGTFPKSNRTYLRSLHKNNCSHSSPKLML
jgi:hypothetical protein